METVSQDDEGILLDVQRPAADLAAERFIQAAKCTDPELRRCWVSIAWARSAQLRWLKLMQW